MQRINSNCQILDVFTGRCVKTGLCAWPHLCDKHGLTLLFKLSYRELLQKLLCLGVWGVVRHTVARRRGVRYGVGAGLDRWVAARNSLVATGKQQPRRQQPLGSK